MSKDMEQSFGGQESQLAPRSDTSKSSEDREQGDTPRLVQQKRLAGRINGYFRAEVTENHADILLLLCCLISGLLDSVVYSAYGTFVSMQTGNTIFLGIGASGLDINKAFGWARSGTSIFCFILGSLFFSRVCRFLGPLRRITLVSSFLLQSIIVLVTAAIVESGSVDGSVTPMVVRPIHWMEEVPIALLSFQSAGQIVGSRALGISEIPTVVVTSVLCDLASDPALVSPLTRNAKRNRRVLAFVGILIGAIAGGSIAKVTGGMEAVLWLAGGIKVVVTCSWVLWPEKPHLAI